MDRARKIPEWEEYDQEVARFAKSLQKSNAIAAVDVEVLASPDSMSRAGKTYHADKEMDEAIPEEFSSTPAIQNAEDATQGMEDQQNHNQNGQHRSIDEW